MRKISVAITLTRKFLVGESRMWFKNKRLLRKKDSKRSLYRTFSLPVGISELWHAVDYVDVHYDENSDTLQVTPSKPQQPIKKKGWF